VDERRWWDMAEDINSWREATDEHRQPGNGRETTDGGKGAATARTTITTKQQGPQWLTRGGG